MARLERDGVPASNSATASSGSSTSPSRAAPPISAPRSGPGCAVPRDRRPGVQELPLLQPEQLGGRRDVHEGRGHLEHRGERPRVGGRASRVGGHGRQVGLGPLHRRPPVDAGDRDGLVGDRVGQQVGADVDDGGRRAHATGSPEPTSSTARRVAPRVGQVHLGAGVRERPDLAVQPLRVGRRTDDRDHDRLPYAGQGGRQQRGRVGLGTVPEHHVEEQHRGVRVGGRAGQVLQPQRRVDHRVRPAGRVGVVPEVDERVAPGS